MRRKGQEDRPGNIEDVSIGYFEVTSVRRSVVLMYCRTIDKMKVNNTRKELFTFISRTLENPSNTGRSSAAYESCMPTEH